jgi:hypothetical protein
MIIYAAVAGVVAYALYKERQALGCPNVPDGTDCDNGNGKAVRGTYSSNSDSTPVVANKTIKAADFASKWVTWRIGLLTSIPCVGFIYYLLYKRVPTEQELLLCVAVITAIIYFMFNFYKFHLIDHARDNVTRGVTILTSRVS